MMMNDYGYGDYGDNCRVEMMMMMILAV